MFNYSIGDEKFSTEPFLGKTVSNFISPDEVSVLLNYCKNTDAWEEIPDNYEWTKRTIDFSLLNGECALIVSNAMSRLQKVLINEYNLKAPIYPDTVNIARMFSGTLQRPHCDDMSDSERDNIKNEFRHRYFGSVIYLNNDFIGGKTFYTEHPIEIDPEPGKLAIHLGDCNHRHSVTRVEGNTRYTISSFWGFDKSLSVPGIIYNH